MKYPEPSYEERMRNLQTHDRKRRERQAKKRSYVFSHRNNRNPKLNASHNRKDFV